MKTHKVLVVPPFNPYPLVSGGHQALFSGIAILKDIADVYMVIDTTESQWKRGCGREIESVLPFVKVVPFINPLSRHTFKWYFRVLRNKIKAILPINPINAEQKESKNNKPLLSGLDDMREDKIAFILQCIRDLHIDIVQAEMIPNIRIVEHLPSEVRKIFVHHELRFVRDSLLVNTQGDLTNEVIQKLQTNKQEEISLLNKYDRVVTLSSVDTNKLLEAGVSVPILISFSAVRDDGIVKHENAVINKVLSFVGPEFHYPNYEGIAWFLDNCWEKLCAKEPEYRLQIIGEWSQDTATYFAETYHGVSCVGFVDNLAEAMDGTTMIVPINIGSGIRMKILEAARIGVPVVSTIVGAEGLPIEDGVHAFITDDPDVFVEDILKLQDLVLRDRFIANTRKTIAEKYSFDALKANRAVLYE